MKNRHLWFLRAMTILWMFIALAQRSGLCQTANQAQGVKCVKREAALEPPRTALPALRTVYGKEQELPKPRKLKPVCPAGEVPVTAFPSDKHFIKGNPMIGNYAAPGPPHALPGNLVNHLLLPFDQVYWKREGKPANPRVNPAIGSGDPPCDGVAWFGACFYYGSASELRVADGGGMTLTIQS